MFSQCYCTQHFELWAKCNQSVVFVAATLSRLPWVNWCLQTWQTLVPAVMTRSTLLTLILTLHYFCLSTGIVRISQSSVVLFSLSYCVCIMHSLHVWPHSCLLTICPKLGQTCLSYETTWRPTRCKVPSSNLHWSPTNICLNTSTY